MLSQHRLTALVWFEGTLLAVCTVMLASLLDVEHAENFMRHLGCSAVLTISAVLGINRVSRKQCVHQKLTI